LDVFFKKSGYYRLVEMMEREFAKSDPHSNSSIVKEKNEHEKGDACLTRTLSQSDDISSMAASKKNRKDLLCSLKKLDAVDFKKYVQEQKSEYKKKQESLMNTVRQHRSSDSLRGSTLSLRSFSSDELDEESEQEEEEEEEEEEVDEEEDELEEGEDSKAEKKVTIKVESPGKGSRKGSLRKTRSDGATVGQKGTSLKKLQVHSMGEFVELKLVEKKRRLKAYGALTEVTFFFFFPFFLSFRDVVSVFLTSFCHCVIN
jgi:hypothetical protein